MSDTITPIIHNTTHHITYIGIGGFYRGWFPALVQKIPSYALTWMFFQQLKLVYLLSYTLLCSPLLHSPMLSSPTLSSSLLLLISLTLPPSLTLTTLSFPLPLLAPHTPYYPLSSRPHLFTPCFSSLLAWQGGRVRASRTHSWALPLPLVTFVIMIFIITIFIFIIIIVVIILLLLHLLSLLLFPALVCLRLSCLVLF